MVNNIQIVNAPKTGRIIRKPKHPFNVITEPWQIQPFFIAPVLAGETLQSLDIKARVVSDPILNPLIGWWQDYYFFYVKHSDLEGGQDFMEMHIDPSKDMSAYDDATDIPTNHKGGTEIDINYVQRCTDVCINAWFRNEGETASDHLINGVSAARIGNTDYLDSCGLTANSEGIADIDYTSTTAGVGDGTAAVTAAEISEGQKHYNFLRSNGMTQMTYSDYLKSFGVNVPAEYDNRPEILREIHQWTYPSNTINASTGAPSSACSWNIAERADKKRFFKEPGFLIGLTVTRPKVYMKLIHGSLTSLMNSAYRWLPAMLSDDAWSSIINIDASNPPLTLVAAEYFVDLKDLLLYGEQFVNFDRGTVGQNLVSIPYNTGGLVNKEWATDDNSRELFVDQADLSTSLDKVRQDGIVQLAISGTQYDTTPNQLNMLT